MGTAHRSTLGTDGVAVIVPTIGRPAQLRACLEALATGSTLPDEVIVVAQARQADTAACIAGVTGLDVKIVADAGRGRGRACNIGLRATGMAVVLFTDDDCTVHPQWVERGRSAVLARDRTIATGRVLTHGDPDRVPALRSDPLPRTYTGRAGIGKLTGGNMAARRSELLALGGFDERMVPAAEDNDLGYRWLAAGGTVQYDPAMVVWHDDWRDDAQLRAVHLGYGLAQGRFYGKHLRGGDVRMLVMASRHLAAGGVLAASCLAHGMPPWQVPRLAFFRRFLPGLASGMRLAGPVAMPSPPSARRLT